jgi:hypothetical protein
VLFYGFAIMLGRGYREEAIRSFSRGVDTRL